MKNLKQFLSIFWLIALFSNLMQAQTECFTPAPTFTASASCGNYLDYLTSSSNVSNIPIKTVRVNIHVMQKSDGSGSFQNTTTTVNFFNNLFASDALVFPYTLNVAPYGANASPTYVINDPTTGLTYDVLPEARIRFRLTGIYFHQDDIGWNYNNNSVCGSYCYNNFGVNKSTDINIFFVNYNGIRNGCGPGKYIVTGDDWNNFDFNDQNNLWLLSSHLSHEMGHCLGLPHTASWGSGGCPISDDYFDDTAYPDKNCWCGCPNVVGPQTGCGVASNNTMGYNQCGGYFSQKQIARMNWHISNNLQSYVDCNYFSSASINITVNSIWSYTQISDRNIEIQSGKSLTINCLTTLPDNAKITINAGATLIVNSTITNICNNAWDGLIEVKPNGNLILQ